MNLKHQTKSYHRRFEDSAPANTIDREGIKSSDTWYIWLETSKNPMPQIQFEARRLPRQLIFCIVPQVRILRHCWKIDNTRVKLIKINSIGTVGVPAQHQFYTAVASN